MNEFSNPINNNDELDDLRLQMNDLKARLDRTTTLNEKLMFNSVKRKMRGVHKSIRKVIFMGLVACPLWILIGYTWNLPWYFTAFTIVMLMASMTADYFINNLEVESMGDNLAETARKLIKMKKMRVKQELIAIPVLIGWLAWFIWELQHIGLEKQLVTGMAGGAIIGAIIGAAIGLRIYFKLQDANDEMLSQINDIQNESN